MGMNSRERIVAALQHKEADRIPFDLGGTESSGITGIAYNNLRRHLGLGPGQTQIFDVYQQIAKIEEDVRAVLPSDTIPLLIEPKRWKPFVLPDGSACQIPEKWNPVKDARGDWVVKNSQGMVTARLPQQGFYFESVYAPLSRVEKPGELAAYADDIESFDWPFYADETWADLAGRAQHLFEHTDRAVVANLQLHLLAAGQDERVGIEADGDAVAGDLSQRGDVALEGRKEGLLVGGEGFPCPPPCRKTGGSARFGGGIAQLLHQVN